MKKQLIIKDSQTAREVNTFGKEPRKATELQMQYTSNIEYNNWQQAESSLKEYKIIGWDECYLGLFTETYPIGSIHTFEVNEETGTCIIL